MPGVTGPTVAWNRWSRGGGSRSFVASRRTRSCFGVGSTCPNPSGRSGNGLAPTRQEPSFGVALWVLRGGGGDVCLGDGVAERALAVGDGLALFVDRSSVVHAAKQPSVSSRTSARLRAAAGRRPSG